MSTSPKRLGKYELQMRLGQGGMAEVWKGFDPQLKRSVAIKFLHANLRSDPDFMNRFLREGQAIAALRHPNIVQVYDFQVAQPEDESPMAYMVMDYIEGSTLAEYIRRTSYAHRFPSANEIVRLFTSLGLAVDYAHQQRMIHRDIKPANILLDTRNTVNNSMGEPILTDFGIVKMLGTAAITSTGISMGTPLYISPEQVHGQPGNEKSDIYALGVMLYEICAGEPPYRGDNPYVILAQRISSPPCPPSQHNPEVSPALDATILRCLALESQERFSSASLLTAALAEAFHVPVPDLVRYALSSSRLEVQPISLPPSQPALPIIKTPTTVSPVDLEMPHFRNNESSIEGGETILSDTGAVVVSAPASSEHSESLPPSTNGAVPVASALIRSSGPVTPLPSSEALPVAPSSQFTVPLPAPQRNRAPIFGNIVLLIVLISAGIGASALLRGSRNAMMPASSASVGSATFFSSGQLDGQNIPFMNDGVQIRLYHISDPTPRHRYYAWLQNPPIETASIFLGALTIAQGSATLSYTDSQHRDLLAQMSRFLVTEQSARVVPDYSSLEKAQWRYSATIPQTTSSVDSLSYLEHLRRLLSRDPALERLQLHHGVDFWLLNNTEEMYKRVLEARDPGNLQEVRQSLATILYFLDGQCAQQELNNVPGGKMSENATLARASSISLLDCVWRARPAGYLTYVARHLNGMVKAPGASVQEVRRTTQVNLNLDAIRGWLEQMHTDVLQLVHLDDAHLEQSQLLRNDLVVQARNVMGGRFDPTTQTLQPGVGQICDEITSLASFEVSS